MQKHIQQTYDAGFEKALTYEALESKIMATPSIKSKCDQVQRILKNCRLRKNVQDRILKKLIPFIIPQGTKGNVRGNTLNEMVKERLLAITKRKKNKHIKVAFETIPKELKGIIHERPDWIVEGRDSMVVGYTQVDLWGGGQQINRAAKYVLNDALHKRLGKMNVKLVCLVSKKPTLSTKKCKTQMVIKKGLKTGRIILPKSLVNVVNELV